MTMICISSNATARYSEDVYRAVSMPDGSRLQFRYDKKYVASELWDQFLVKRRTGGQVCLVFADWNRTTFSENSPIEYLDLIPCRIARLVDVETISDFATLTLELGGFPNWENRRQMQFALNAHFDGFPQKKRIGEQTQTSGVFCWEGKREDLFEETTTANLAVAIEMWKRIVDELATRKPFVSEIAFFYVSSIKNLNSDCRVLSKNGDFSIKSETRYALEIIHYMPERGDSAEMKEYWLTCESLEDLDVIHNRFVALDHRYDKTDIEFRVDSAMSGKFGAISFYRGPKRSTEVVRDNAKHCFDIAISVPIGTAKKVIQGVVGGVLLASPSMFTAMEAKQPPRLVDGILCGLTWSCCRFVCGVSIEKADMNVAVTNLEILRRELEDLRAKLQPVFAKDTALPGSSETYLVAGHCAAVSIIVRELYGGEFVSTLVDGKSHWFNRLFLDGVPGEVDITADQFGFETVRIGFSSHLYSAPRVRLYMELNAETRRRAAKLARRAGLGEIAQVFDQQLK